MRFAEAEELSLSFERTSLEFAQKGLMPRRLRFGSLGGAGRFHFAVRLNLSGKLVESCISNVSSDELAGYIGGVGTMERKEMFALRFCSTEVSATIALLVLAPLDSSSYAPCIYGHVEGADIQGYHVSSRPAFHVQHPTSSISHRASHVQHLTSSISHLAWH